MAWWSSTCVIAFTDFGDQYLRHTIGEKILYDLRVRLYDHLQRLSLSFFERTSTGELMSRVSNDVNALEQFMTHGTILAGVAVVRLFGATIVLLLLDWRLALIALLPVPIIAGGLRWFNKRHASHLPAGAGPAGRREHAAAGRPGGDPGDSGVRPGIGRA